jgi:hypothetical protein
MKKVLLAVAATLLLGPYAVQAAEDCFSWKYTQNDNATAYRIYRDPSTDVQFVFPDFAKEAVCPDPDNADRCKACVTKLEDGRNHRFAATAYNSVTDQESDFSQYVDVMYDGVKTEMPPVQQGPTAPEVLQYLIEATIKKIVQ